MIWRVVLAAAVAALSVVVLQWGVAASSESNGSRSAADAEAEGPSEWASGVELPDFAARVAVLREVRSPVWLVYAATELGQLPARAAPVFRLGADGVIHTERPPPLSSGPASAWLAVGLVLPDLAVRRWTPKFRAVVLSVFDALSAPRTIAVRQLVTPGRVVDAAAWGRLFAWRRR